MAHSVDIPYLDNESINKYFESLAKYIIEAGIGEHRILVVGGAAMALKYIDNRSTSWLNNKRKQKIKGDESDGG